MADVQSNIQVSIDTTQALASIKNLQRQISAFHSSMAKGGAAANAVSAQMQQTLINSINATGKFSAQIRTIRTTTESFTDSLEKNKFSLGEYFRYAGGASKTFGRLFKTEFDTINKVARENVKDLQTQYIRLGRDASGAMKSIAVRPLSLDMGDLATRTMIASEKQALLNQLLKQGSTNLLNFGKNTQWAGRQLMVGFTLPLIAVGTAASKTFMDMEAQAIRFKKVYGDLFTPTGESQQALKDIQELGKEFTKYGIAVSTTVGLAAEAAAAGFKGVDLQRQTAAATRLSILGQVESQKALETTIALQNAFSMSSENLAESIDFLNAVENQTVLSLDDISTAIPKAAPVVQQLGGDIKDLAFLMTAMKEGGINASEGANALKSGLASLINPTGKANEMLLSFGINAKKIVLDNKGDLKKTVVEFATALNMLDPLNRAQAIEQMFGKFQFARLSTLFANVTKEGTQASRVLDLAGASVQELASLAEKELGMTSESAMNKFKGAVENLKLSLIPLGEQFLKAVTPIAEFITRILDKFNNLSDSTKKIIVTVTAVVAGLGPVFLMTFGLLANGLANIIKGFTFLKTLFNKTGQSTATLGTEVRYMTTEQRNAAAVAASLDQVHVKLAQTFTSEAAAVNALTQAYQRAIAAQSQFVPVGPPITRGPIPKRAKGKPATVGGTGNKDSELALLMPGETVIPTAMSAKYGGLINAMIADKVPGYKRGVPTTGTSVKIPGGFAAAHFGGSEYRTGAELLAMVEGLDTVFAKHIRTMVAEVSGGIDRVFTVFTNEVVATSTTLNEAVGKTGSRKTAPIALAKQDLVGTGAATRDIELQRQLEAAGVPIEEIRIINKKITERIKVGFKKLGDKATVTAEELDKLVDDAYAEVAKTDDRVRSARTKMKQVTAVTDPRTDSRVAVSDDPYFKHRKSGRYFAGMERAAGAENVPYERNARFKINNAMAAQIGLSSRDAALVYKQFSDEVKVRLASLRGDIVKFSVEFAKEAEKAGIKTGNAYKVGLDKVVTADPYLRSRDRSSPHRLAAQDGRDDARAYAAARDKETRKQSGRARRAATRQQGPAPIGATPQPGMTVLPIVSQPTEKDLRRTRNRDRLTSAKAKMSGTFGGGRGMGISTGLMIGSQFLPGKSGEIAGKVSGLAFGLQALAMLPGPLKLAAVGLGLVALSAKGLSIVQERQRRAVSAMADVATITTKKLQTLGDFFGVAVKKLPYEVARDSSGTLSPLGATQRSQVDALRADQAFQDNFKNDISALKTATKQDATLVLNSLAIQLKGRGYASEQIKTIIQALQEEARRRDLELEFKNIGVSTEQIIKQQARVIGAQVTQLNSLGDLVVGTGNNLFREMTKGDPWSAKLVSEDVKAQLETAAAAMFGTIQGMIGQFQAGELSAEDLSIQINILSNEISKIPPAGQVAFMDRVFKQLSPEARTAASNIKGVNTQMKVLLALSTGIISAEDKLLKVLSTATDPKVLGRAQAQLSKKMKNFFKIFEENTIADAVVDTEDYQESTDGLSTASEAYLKILEKEIDGLEAKRDAQKNSNDETQRQIDLQMKLKDLANQAVLAKISGDYLKAATLQQQAQNVQMEFDQETELRKKDAEIARLKAREAQIKGGAPITKAEAAKIPKNAGIKKSASGGMIRGAGTGTSDSIPAYLSNGEYVIKADSVKKYGVGTFDSLNAQRLHTGGPVGHKHGPAEAASRRSLGRLNIPVSAGSTATMFSPATGLANDPKFQLDAKEATGFSRQLGDMFNFAMKPFTPSQAPKANKQSDYSKKVREAYDKTIRVMHNVYAPSKVGTFFMKPTMDAMLNVRLGEAKWNDYTTIGSNFLGYGLIKTAVKGVASGVKNIFTGTKAATTKIKAPKTPSSVIPKPNISSLVPEEKAQAASAAAAAKPQGLLKKLTNLPAARKAEALIRQKQIADDIARFKANPPPPRPPRPGAGAPGAPPASTQKSMFDPDFDWDSIPTSAAFAAKPSIFSKIADSPIGQMAKTLSRTATTPAYHLKSMAQSAKRAWRYGSTGTRWQGTFDRMGRLQLADEAISRLFGAIGSRFNPMRRIAEKTKNLPDNLPEGSTPFDPLNFFEKLLLDPKLPANFYKTTYKNIIPNLRNNYVTPAYEGLRSSAMSGLYKMSGISQTAASRVASKSMPIKDTAAAVMRSLSYKMKSAVKDKFRSFLNIFRATKVGKPFDNSAIDYRTLMMTGQKVDTMHSPEIAEEILGGSQYYIKMLSKIRQSKEIFGSEWMHRVDLPAPVNRPMSNTPDNLIGKQLEDTQFLASESFAPQGYSTVTDFLKGATSSTNVFNPNDLGQVITAGIVPQRIAADVAQSVLGHKDLHTGNQIIDLSTGKIGMLDFETILSDLYPAGLEDIAETLKIRGVNPEFIADSFKQGLAKITDIPPSEIFEMLKKAKVPNPEQVLETYMARLDMTKQQIDEIISTKLFLANGGYIDKEKVKVPKFAKGGLIKGPGTGISDSVRATLGYAGGGSIRVSNGEYVVKASSVRDYGVKTMDAINNGTATVGTESGGTVYNINMPVTSNNANPEIVANEVMRKLKLEISKNNKTNRVGG